jgi:hypothetical protein
MFIFNTKHVLLSTSSLHYAQLTRFAQFLLNKYQSVTIHHLYTYPTDLTFFILLVFHNTHSEATMPT